MKVQMILSAFENRLRAGLQHKLTTQGNVTDLQLIKTSWSRWRHISGPSMPNVWSWKIL